MLQVLHHRVPKRDNVERERNATLWNSPSAEAVHEEQYLPSSSPNRRAFSGDVKGTLGIRG